MRRILVILAIIAAFAATPARAYIPYEAEIRNAASIYGVSADWMIDVMMCESEGEPYAVNPTTGDTGLFQYNPGTWAAWGGNDIWNPYEQIEMTAWAFSNGLADHWVCSGLWDGSPS